MLDSKSLQLPLVVLSRLQLVDLGIINFLERMSKQLSLKLKQLGLIIIHLRPVLKTPRDQRASLFLPSLMPIAMSSTPEGVLARMRNLPRTSKRS